MKVKIKCINSYIDKQLNKDIPVGHEWIVDKKRYDELLANPNNLIELVEYIQDEKPKEKAIKPKKNVEKRKTYTITIKDMNIISSGEATNSTTTQYNPENITYTKD